MYLSTTGAHPASRPNDGQHARRRGPSALAELTTKRRLTLPKTNGTFTIYRPRSGPRVFRVQRVGQQHKDHFCTLASCDALLETVYSPVQCFGERLNPVILLLGSCTSAARRVGPRLIVIPGGRPGVAKAQGFNLFKTSRPQEQDETQEPKSSRAAPATAGRFS